MEGRSRRDNLPIDEILEYEEESWDETKELLKDALRDKLGETRFKLKEPIEMEQKKGGKDRTIVAKFSSYKGKQRVLNEVRRQKRKDICENFSKATVAIRKEI